MVPVVDLSRRAAALRGPFLEAVDEILASGQAWARECVTVPCFPEMTDDEVALVAAALADLPG